MKRYPKSFIAVLAILLIVVINPPTSNAITNGVPAAEGIAVKVISDAGLCTGTLWKLNIVITAAHCVVQTSGVIATGISANAYIYDHWVKSEVIGIKLPKDYTGTAYNIYSQSSYSDIAFLILKDKLWDNLAFPDIRIATQNDWDSYKTSQTWLEEMGYGFTSDSGPDSPYNKPQSAMFYLDVSLSAGGKDWAVFHSATSSPCHGDSGGPVIYFRSAEKTIVIVGVLISAPGTGSNCGSFQFGSYTGVFTKVSNFAELAASTLNTESKYRVGADIIKTAYESLDNYRTNTSDLSDYAELLPPATKKRLFDNNKNVAALYTLIEDYGLKVNDQEEILNQSMEFTFINSGVLEANSAPVGGDFETSFKPFEAKIKALLPKISKVLPTYVCTNDLLIKDLPSSKKCAKGYTKFELTKPF